MKKHFCLFICIFFLILGCDQSVNMLLGVGQALDNEPPKISVTSPENGIYVNKSDITITGTCSDNVGVTKISVSAGLTGVTSVSTEEISLKSVRDGSWSVTFNKDKLDRELNLWHSGLKVTFTLTCYDAAGNSVVEHIFLYIDTDLPEVTINKPETRFGNDEKIEYEKNALKFAEDYNINKFEKVNSFVNKEFTIKGYVDDNYSVKSTYINIYNSDKKKLVAVTPEIYRNGNSEKTSDIAIGSVTGNSQSWEFQLDSMEFCTSEGWYALEVVTEDEAGNERRQFVDKHWIYVNQAADIPKNNFTSFSEGFKLNAGNVIAGYCFDDDGMREVWIKIVPESEADADTPYTEWKEVEDAAHIIKKSTDFTVGTQMGNWSLKIPSKAGSYKIYAVPVDINGVSPTVPYDGIYVSSFSVASEEDPVVGIDSQFRGSTIVEKTKITGYFYDNNAVTKISVAMKFDDEDIGKVTELYNFKSSENKIRITKQDNNFQLTTGQTVTKYFFEWDFDTDEYQAYKVLQMSFKAEDEDSNYGEDAITIYGDSERPSFVGEISPANNSNVSDKIVFSGAVSDNVDVVKVIISANGSAWREDIECELGNKELLGSGKYKRTFMSREITPQEFGGYVDREFTITAKDAAGNESNQIITLKGDKTKPIVKFVDEDGNDEKSGNYVTTSKVLNIRLIPAAFADQTYREIKKVVYSINSGDKKSLNLGKVKIDEDGKKYYPVQIKVADLSSGSSSDAVSGDVTLQVTATDAEGSDGEGTIYFIVDNEPPTDLTITSPLLKDKSYITGLTSIVDNINENEISYYQNGTVFLKGTISDNYKISKTILSFYKIDEPVSSLTCTLTIDSDGKMNCNPQGSKSDIVTSYSGIPGNFTLAIDTTKLDDGNYQLKATAYDAAGNSASWGNEPSEECYFKILQDADKPRITFNVDFDSNMKAQIFPGTILKGLLIDDDAMQSVKYILGTTQYSDSEAMQLFADGANEVKTLPGVKEYTRQDWSLSGFESVDIYYLYMLAKDINGKESNLYKRTISVVSTDSPFIKSVSQSAGTGGKEANGYYSGKIKILVSANGGSCGLKYMEYRILSESVTSSDEVADNTLVSAESFELSGSSANLGKWQKYQFNNTKESSKENIAFEFDSSLFVKNSNETITVQVRCTNIQGVVSAEVKDKVAVDNEGPQLKVASPNSGASVNKEFEINGSCSDKGAGVKDIYISYLSKEPASLKLAQITGNLSNTPALNKWYKLEPDEIDGLSWSSRFDSTIIHSEETVKNYAIVIAATDMLDNLGKISHEVKIDHDGDRPIVRIQNLTLKNSNNATVWCKSASIYGTVSDDDSGNVEVYVSEDGGLSWSQNCYGNGSWQYDFQSDGEKTLMFKVKDAAGTVFISQENKNLTAPKVTDSSANKFGNESEPSTKFTIKVDTQDPKMSDVYYNFNPTTKDSDDVPDGVNGGIVDSTVWSTSFADKIFGGTENAVWFLFGGDDANGIAGGKLFCTTVGSKVKISDSPVVVTHGETKTFYKYKVDISDVTDSLLTFRTEITDNSGLTSSKSFTIDIDNAAPAVEIRSHNNGGKVYGTETNSIKGITTDSNKVVKLEYALTKTKTMPSSGYTEIEDNGGFVSWEILFGGKNILNEKLRTLYAVAGEFSEEPYDLYLWIKAADMLGNVNEPSPFLLKVYAMGDKPKISIGSPENNEVLGGTITVSGETEISTSFVKQVYLQIDPSYETSFSSSWESELKALSSGYEIKTDPTASSVKGIEVTSSSKANWRLNINKDKNLNGTVALKAIAVSETGKYTESEIVVFRVDSNLPEFGDLTLVQYDKSGKQVKSRAYSPEMWITGSNWFIEGSVSDENGINSVTSIPPAEIKLTEITNGYKFKIPVTTDGFGSIDLKVEAEDKSENLNKTITQFLINYDNTPPKFSAEKLSVNASNRTRIENSNGVYTINGNFEEEGSGTANQSGFERIAMFFTRTIGSETYIIDSMRLKGDSGIENRSKISSGFIKGDDGIYWIAEEAEVSGSEITLKNSASNDIRIGGLCKVDGIIYKINEVSGNVITLNESLSAGSDRTVYFAAAQVIDNLTVESGKTTYYADEDNYISYDDGDKMVEGVVRVGTNYEWTVSINSENIFDGNLDIHFVAFDKAGNYTKEYIFYGKVTNNAPRIAGVTFGTDNNGNDLVDNDELNSGFENIYNASASVSDGRLEGVGTNGKLPNGTKVTELDLPLEGTNVLTTIKGLTLVKAKIVGGNSGLKWQWSIGNGKWSALKALSSGSSYNDDIRNEDLEMKIAMSDFLNAGVGNNDDTMLKLRIWDETEGFVAGKDSQYAQINIRVKTVLEDNEKPVIKILPFYWRSATENSLYKNSSANGHIELESDLPSAKFTSGGTGIFDRDPKVSGKITIDGTASDNVLLKALSLEIPTFLTSRFVAQRNSTGEWISAGNMESDGWACEVYDDDFTISGNMIKWKLHLDTEKIITDYAKADVRVVMTAQDRGKATASGSNVTYTSNISDAKTYQMDVVPYITGVKTYLSNTNKKNPSVYSRTAHGHYPVKDGETVTFTGFNLGSQTSAVIEKTGEFKVTVNNIDSLNNLNSNNAKGSYSLDITNDDYANAYNRQPNNLNNNLLDDDVYFDVWQINSKAVAPVSGMIEQPVMKINPNSGMVGFAFVNGPLYFSMGGKVGDTEYSAQYWMGSYDFFTSVGFVYDKLGYSYGCAAGGDINSASADKFQFMTSRWGIANIRQNGSYGNTNSLRMESIAQKNNSGVRIFDKQRIKSPSFATAVHGTSTNVYLAYYDNINDEIRFKYGKTSSTTRENFGDFVDYDTAGDAYEYRKEHVSMIAGGTTGRNAGEYVSIAVVSYGNVEDKVVAVWYDSADRCLKYSYNETPTTNTGKWSVPTNVFTGDMENAGEWCQIVVDGDGGIHIAAYDPINLDLVYAYKSDYKTSETGTCVIDGYGVVGSNLTLDVAKNKNGKWIPYIGYYATSCVKPKIAYLTDTSSSTPEGTIEDEVTKAWEISVIPTTSIIPLGSQGNNRMNVGIWKDKDSWQIKGSLKGTNTGTHSGSSYNATCWDKVYGNGTSNPIMGYAIKESTTGYIETAQLK